MGKRATNRFSFTRRRLAVAGLSAIAELFSRTAVTRAAGPSQFVYFFNNSISLQGGTGALGGFYFTGNASNPQFYTLGFVGSTQGIYQDTYSTSNSTWSSSLFINNQTSGTNDWLKFALSSSVSNNSGNGTIVSADSATPTIGDMIVNPAPITVGGINYAAGTLGIILDAGKTKSGSTNVPSLSKLVYAYDLRAVTYDPNTLLENNPTTPGYNDHNGDGIVEWNDVFTPIVNFQDQINLNPGTTASTANNVGRRPVFSSDGQSVYFVDISTAMGGIYKVNLTQTDMMSKVLSAPLGSLSCEPGVVASSVRNFGGGSGDQIIFNGGADTGNTGGINFIVDNGTTVSASKVLVSAKQMQWFLDQPNGGADTFGSFTSDSSGNVFAVNSGASNYGGTIEYDSQGRLVKIFSQGEQRWFEYTESTPVAFNGSVLELKIAQANVTLTGASSPTTINQLQYRDVGTKAPVGVNLYLPGDFNHDGVVDAADVALFKQQIGLRGVPSVSIGTTTGNLPVNNTTDGSYFSTSGQAALAANAGVPFQYDLNGSYTSGSTVSASVDWKDVKVFQQFAGFSDGDVNLDGTVNAADLSTLASNYGLNNKVWTDGKLSSVRINAPDANTVGFVDLVTEAANWPVASLGKPALSYNASGGTDLIPSATLDRAFAITAGGTISQIANTSSGSVNWGTAATWTNGDGASIVPNSPGAVASFLNKATNDTTVSINGNYTVGQLNFDNYFTFTLSGTGTLHLAGNNGTSAEINTFAQSPIIATAVALDSPTNITITYASDTASFSGSVSGTGSLNKFGAGTVLLSGANSYSGGTNVSAGTVQATGPASLPGYSTAGKLSVSAGAAVVLNVGGSTEWTQTSVDALRSAATIATGSSLGFDTTDAAGSATLASNLTGGISVIKQGANTLQLSGTNTYTGTTLANAGTLLAKTPAALPGYGVANQVIVASGATVAVNVGGSGEWTPAQIDTLRANISVSIGSAFGIDTTDAPGGFTYASVITGTGIGFSKLGPNTLSLTGSNTYNGSTSVLGGTLSLNFGGASASTNILATTSPLVLANNGGLTVLGKASTTNGQTIAGLTLNAGSAAIVATASTSNPLLLALGTITRNIGSTVDFTDPSGTQSATNGITTSTSTLSAWATVNQTDWAAKSSSNIVALAAGSYTSDTWASSNNTTVATSNTIAANSSTNTLRFAGTGSYTLALSGVNNIVTGGILVAPSVGANTDTFTGGTLTGKAGTDLVINQFDASGNLEIDSVIADSSTATALTKSGGGLLTVTAANSYTGATYLNAGTLNVSAGSLASTSYTVQGGAKLNVISLNALPTSSTINDGGTVTFGPNTASAGPASVTIGSLLLDPGGVVSLADAPNHGNRTVLIASNFSIAGGVNAWTATLNIGANDLVLHNASLQTITNMIASGYNVGSWNGMGLTSSTAAGNPAHLTAIGVIANNDGSGNALYSSTTPLGNFDGLNPSTSDLLVKYTYYGDSNLDGKVDSSDYARIDYGFLAHGSLTGWFNGDFNYDGVINGSDYTLIDNAFNTQGAALTSQFASPTSQVATPGASTSVPEPTSLGFFAMGLIGLLGRRRHK